MHDEHKPLSSSFLVMWRLKGGVRTGKEFDTLYGPVLQLQAQEEVAH